MVHLTPETTAALLHRHGYRLAGAVTPLGGGVSNTVLLAPTDRGRLVLKQALEQLRVEADWRSDPARTLRECSALQAVAPLHAPGDVPAVFFLDRENLVYAMEAAPEGAADWKTLLLSGEIDPSTAAGIGRLLAKQIAATWNNPAWAQAFGDQTVFDELRLDPYYRHTAERHPDLAHRFAALIARCRERAMSLVHGDWSPKNFLVAGGRPMAIDYEVVHYGDASFDAGFLLNHLLLKAIHRPEWAARFREAAEAFLETLRNGLPAAAADFAEGTKAHLGGLLLARVDGKSPAEYLRPREREQVRELGRAVLAGPPANVLDLWRL